MTPTIIDRIISGVLGLALVGGGIYLLTIGESVEGAGLIAGGVGTIALRGVRGVPKGGGK
ncbi:MAG: hypothetical protein IH885_10470 [Myxococcales bacterium]|nr:hypothetical protein [Myxococcales bacterium]